MSPFNVVCSISWIADCSDIALSVDVDDPIGTYNPYNSSALQNLFPSISFPDYFASFTPRPRYPDPVIVATPSFFSKLSKLLDNTAPDVLEAYFAYETAQSLSSLLSSKEPVRRQIDQFQLSLVGLPADAKRPRKEVCLEQITDSYGFLVGRYFVQKAFPGESKEYAEEVIEAIIQAFRDRLPGLSWLDKVTREKAKEKVDAISHKVSSLILIVSSVTLNTFVSLDWLSYCESRYGRSRLARTLLLDQRSYQV